MRLADRIAFDTPNPHTGVSDKELVQSGKAITKDMSRWV